MRKAKPVELKELDLSLIDRDPDQPRKTFRQESIAKLAHSIKSGKLWQPLTVKPHPLYPKRYLLVAGERRLRALKMCGITKDLCIVRRDASDTFKISLAENCNREDLNPIDEALAFKRCREQEGMTFAEISEFTGKSVSTIFSRLKLLSLPEEIKNMVRDGTLPRMTALGLAQYRGPRGELLRLAHDLLAGRGDAELLLEKTDHNVAVRIQKSRLPASGPGLLQRILHLGWRTRSEVLALRAFLKLPAQDQREGLQLLKPPAVSNLLQNLADLAEAASAFVVVFGGEERPAKSHIP